MKKILIVDDEQEIVDFLEHFLKRLKITVVKAASGEEALELYDKEQIDFVFLDVQMKGMNGLEVFAELKKRHPAVKVIMITGRGEKEYVSKAEKLGALDYLTKPLDLGELREKIEKYIL